MIIFLFIKVKLIK